MSINHQEEYHKVSEAILTSIKREASAIELYERLAAIAPNQKHEHNILQALEFKKGRLHQFNHLYTSLTEKQPYYHIDQITFASYSDGLIKAHEAGIEGYKEYRRNCLLTHNPIVHNVFQQASSGEIENATRFGSLNEDEVIDQGMKPFVINIEEAAKQNQNFRAALWTGRYFQVTVMSIDVGSDIGLEVHPTTDQFVRIEEGQGIVQMGDSKNNLNFVKKVKEDYAIMIPAGKWHNLTNTGDEPLKIYVIYAPPQHPFGTVHETKEVAMAAE